MEEIKEIMMHRVNKDGISMYDRFIEPIIANTEPMEGKDLEADVIDPIIEMVGALLKQREEKVSKRLTVEEALRWSDKHIKLTSKGARVAHIRHLLESLKENT